MTERPTPPTDHIGFLDGLRGLAAVYVMLGHARYVLHEGFSSGFQLHPESYSRFDTALIYFFSLFRFGREGVFFFFVLSGFVIHLRYAKQLAQLNERPRFGLASYLVRRARRLYPPLVFAIVLTFVLDRTGMALGFPIYSGDTPYPVINSTLVPRHDAAVVLGNLAFLMPIYVPTFGTDGPLWSLMYEWWFYMLYPLFWALTTRSIALATALMVALFALTYWHDVWPLDLLHAVFSLMLIWWMGALLADIYVGRLHIPMWALSPLAILLPFSALLHLAPVAWGVGFVGVIAAGLAWQQRGGGLAWLNRLKFLGDMSYTLYVCHMPILVFIGGWLMLRSPDHRLPRHFGFAVLGVAVAMLVSWFAHLVTERPFVGPRKKRPSAAA